PPLILFCEFEHQLHMVGKAFNEPVIKICKTKEGLNLLLICQCGPLCYTGYLDCIHTNLAFGDDQPKIFDGGIYIYVAFVCILLLMHIIVVISFVLWSCQAPMSVPLPHSCSHTPFLCNCIKNITNVCTMCICMVQQVK
ncbi:hypothetical protein L208DRAFT_1280359, partial [Tricholoma matsutake]